MFDFGSYCVTPSPLLHKDIWKSFIGKKIDRNLISVANGTISMLRKLADEYDEFLPGLYPCNGEAYGRSLECLLEIDMIRDVFIANDIRLSL